MNDLHRFVVVSAEYCRPFLLGAYPTLDNAITAQCGSPEKWHIFERHPAPDLAAEVKKLRKQVETFKEGWRISDEGRIEAEAEVAHLTAERDALRAALEQIDRNIPEYYTECFGIRATVRNALAFATADNLTSRDETAV